MCENVVYTRDWIEDRTKHTVYGNTQVTALAEMGDGSLVVGDAGGHIYCKKRKKELSAGGEVEQIFPLAETRCLAQQGDQLLVFDLARNKQIQVLERGLKTFVTAAGNIVWQEDGWVRLYQWSEKGYQCIWSKPYVTRVSPFSNGTIVVMDVEKKMSVIFDNGHTVVVPNNHNGAIGEVAAWVNNELVCKAENRCTYLEKKSSWTTKGAILPGDEIVDLIPLSSGEMACATRGSQGILCVLTSNEIGASVKVVMDIPEDSQVEKLIELPNGVIVLKSRTAITLFRCAESLGETDETLHVLLRKLQTAISASQFYMARRAYEKAKRIRCDKGFLRMVLSYLRHSMDKKLHRQVYADLHGCTGVLEGLQVTRACKKRLLVGEWDFVYTEALINTHAKTHPKLAEAITATTWESLPHAKERMQKLRESGVTVLTGIDPQAVHEMFRGKKFERIHWNAPLMVHRQLAVLNFFVSCQQLQFPGNRIYVTLVQEEGSWKVSQTDISLCDASTASGYRLIRKRLFGEGRYRDYQRTSQGMPHGGMQLREFVFEKARGYHLEGIYPSDPNPMEKLYHREQLVPGPHSLVVEEKKAEEWVQDYYVCSTDEDSSDYYESDSS